MDLGLPFDYFIHELLMVATYAVLTVVCARHWDHGSWARFGAIAAALGFVFRAWSLASFVLLTNGHPGLREMLDGLGTPAVWVDLGVLVGLAAAVLLGRSHSTAVEAPTS